jgi:spectinomycin phosphotransferase
MRIEPTFDHDLLKDALRRHYGLSVERLTFVPQGEVAFSYIVMCADGVRYYLKILDDSRLARLSASRLDFTLPLTYELHARGIFPYLPCPVKTRAGALSTTFGAHRAILCTFIEGVNPDETTLHSPAVWAQLARHVATLHTYAATVVAECPFVETFTLPFESALCDGLRALETVTKNDGIGRLALRDLLLPHQATVFSYLERLHALAEQARAAPPPLVLCHTDIHGMNLLLHVSGDLYILDWEGAMAAPREHDLYMFTGDHFPAFLAEYRRWAGAPPLCANLFGFYFYRRNLEDLTDWIVRILYENTDEAQNRLDLESIRHDCVAVWPYFEIDVSNA